MIDKLDAAEYRIYDLHEDPHKNIWKSVLRESRLRSRENESFPDSFEQVRESDRYELEILYSGKEFSQAVENIVTRLAEDEESIDLAQWQGVKILEQRIEDMFHD